MGQSIAVTVTSLIGNTIVLYVLSRPKFWKMMMYKYMFMATFFDTLNALTIWINNYPNFFLMNELTLSCQLCVTISNITGAYSSWINVIASVSNFIMVTFPAKYEKLNKKIVQLIICLVLFVILCLMNIPNFIYYSALPGYGCVIIKNWLILTVFQCIYIIMLPGFLMIIFTCLIYYGLKKSSAMRSKLKKHKKLLNVLFTINIYFLLTNTPQIVLIFILLYTNIQFSYYFLNLATLLGFLYCCLNILVFSFSSSRFRQSTVSLFKCRKI